MTTDMKIATLRQTFAQRAADRFDRFMSRSAESPIEQLFIGQMLVDGWGSEHPQWPWTMAHEWATDAGIDRPTFIFMTDECACVCVAQANVSFGPDLFRVDFAFVGHTMRGEMVRIALELDGHDFHERTKEQASRDKRRDRILTANGWKPVRLSGSDVFRDPAAAVEEIRALCDRLCWPELEPRK